MPLKLVRAPFDLVSTLFNRMTGEQELDALLAVYGEKGTGKSELCMYLAERLDHKFHKKYKHELGTHFTIQNVRSVDKEGTLEMFTSDQLVEKKNQIFVIDDASIASNARDFHSDENKRLNSIMTVARIYRHCVILNTIEPEFIDKVLRGFANITCVTIGPDMNPHSPLYHTNKIKVYTMSKNTAPAKKNRHTYNKYFEFNDSKKRPCRVMFMRTRRPSKNLLEAYVALRKKKTDKLILEMFPKETPPEDSPVIKAPRVSKWDQMLQDNIVAFGSIIQKNIDDNGGKLKLAKAMSETGLSRQQIYRIAGKMHDRK